MKLALFIFLSSLITSAHAETLYTTSDDTIVRDKPGSSGSTIVAHLAAGSMIETEKPVGSFTAVSYIDGGKVRQGFIQTAHLPGSAVSTVSVGSARDTLQEGAPLLEAQLERMQVSEKDLANFASSGKLIARRPKARSK